MIQDCPKCRLTCPPGTRYCDCGYDFETGTVNRTQTSSGEPSVLHSPDLAMIGLACVLGGFGVAGYYQFIDVWGVHIQEGLWLTFIVPIGLCVGMLGLLILVSGMFGRSKR